MTKPTYYREPITWQQDEALPEVTPALIAADQVAEAIDAGPVYFKTAFDLRYGTAQQLYEQASKIIFGMMDGIIQQHPDPHPQKGEPSEFTRRSPRQSELPVGISRRQLYDFIRMLDAEGYPRAFIRVEGRKIELKIHREIEDR